MVRAENKRINLCATFLFIPPWKQNKIIIQCGMAASRKTINLHTTFLSSVGPSVETKQSNHPEHGHKQKNQSTCTAFLSYVAPSVETKQNNQHAQHGHKQKKNLCARFLSSISPTMETKQNNQPAWCSCKLKNKNNQTCAQCLFLPSVPVWKQNKTINLHCVATRRKQKNLSRIFLFSIAETKQSTCMVQLQTEKQKTVHNIYPPSVLTWKQSNQPAQCSHMCKLQEVQTNQITKNNQLHWTKHRIKSKQQRWGANSWHCHADAASMAL